MSQPTIRLTRLLSGARQDFEFSNRIHDAARASVLSDTAEAPSSFPTYAERAQALYTQRRSRVKTFGEHAEMFQEPAWDILLDLYLAHVSETSLQISSVATGSDVPPSTVLRWLKVLEERRLVHFVSDRNDRRRRWAGLTHDAIDMIQRYLDTV